MAERSSKAEVRNPVLALPAAKKLLAQPEDVRTVVRELLLELATDARQRAEKCWRTHKAPMALYWKCVAVYARHIARSLKPKPSILDLQKAV